MKASIVYRVAAALLLLFAVGHTLGFSQPDPAWHVDGLVGMMRSVHFDVMGSQRGYWDFFIGTGVSVGVFLLFSSVLAWQLGGLPPEILARMRTTRWGFALCFAAISVLSWMYLFIIPVAFSVAVTVCLVAAAWLSSRPAGDVARV